MYICYDCKKRYPQNSKNTCASCLLLCTNCGYMKHTACMCMIDWCCNLHFKYVFVCVYIRIRGPTYTHMLLWRVICLQPGLSNSSCRFQQASIIEQPGWCSKSKTSVSKHLSKTAESVEENRVVAHSYMCKLFCFLFFKNNFCAGPLSFNESLWFILSHSGHSAPNPTRQDNILYRHQYSFFWRWMHSFLQDILWSLYFTKEKLKTQYARKVELLILSPAVRTTQQDF